MPTKAESIAQSEIHSALFGFVESIIQRQDIGVVVEMVGRGRYDVVLYGQDGGDGLHSTGGTQ